MIFFELCTNGQQFLWFAFVSSSNSITFSEESLSYNFIFLIDISMQRLHIIIEC